MYCVCVISAETKIFSGLFHSADFFCDAGGENKLQLIIIAVPEFSKFGVYQPIE